MRIKCGILASKFISDREHLLPNVAKVCVVLANQSARGLPLRSIAPQPEQETAEFDDEQKILNNASVNHNSLPLHLFFNHQSNATFCPKMT